MKQLYAPWRSSYIRTTQCECPFCIPVEAPHEPSYDAERFIIARYKTCFMMLNIYPYNAGHLLIIPYAHVPTLGHLSVAERAELIEVTSLAHDLVCKVLGNEATNIGLNLGGKPAGGTIPDHLHMHLVPRWTGDTGFLAVLAQVKPISMNLHEIYERLVAGTR